MNIFAKISDWFERRNMAIAYSQQYRQPQPIYSSMSIKKAVAEGYKSNSWVYRSVFLKAKAASSVQWYVTDSEGQKIDEHSVTKLFLRPNPYISRQDLLELVVSWLELSGNSYLKKAVAQGSTKELWPISPDRLHPIPTKDIEKWMEGYALDRSKTVTYQPDEIIHHKYFNPANPLIGIAPLEVVSKTVDVDSSQRDFNQATSQNRGVVDGIFTFKQPFRDQKDTDAIRDKLNERHGGKRTFGVLGGDAKYVRTALSPAEMDFIESRKANREEIFIAFGVPPVYAGVMEGATMNNYKTSELVFWFGTMLFLLDDLKDTFNFSLYDEIGEGNRLVYDLTGIPAIRDAMLSKTKTAESLFKMGVPFEQLNKIFQFGVDKFSGWDISMPNPGSIEDKQSTESQTRARAKYTLVETRAAADTEEQIEKESDKNAKVFEDLLSTQQEAVFDALASNMNADITKVIAGTRSLWIDRMNQMYIQTGREFGKDMVIEKRAIEDDITKEIEDYLYQESVVLTEISYIEATTVDKIIDHVRSAVDTGATTAELQQAIIDTGIFDEKRALMLSRTLTGTAANLGQVKAAELGGAETKTWLTAGFEVRDSHKKLDGVTIGINEKFRVGSESALFPLANNLSPKNRVN